MPWPLSEATPALISLRFSQSSIPGPCPGTSLLTSLILIDKMDVFTFQLSTVYLRGVTSGSTFRLIQPPRRVAAASLYFLLSFTHFGISLPANPKNPSCHACVIMPGRRLFRISARIPNSKPYTRIMMADRQP